MRKSVVAVLAALSLTGAAPALGQPAPDGAPIVIGASHAVPSAVLGETRRVNVWLPASYGSGDGRYPVLYLIDGGMEEDFHHISGLAQISGAYGVTREFIVVGVESGATRKRDLTFPSADPEDIKQAPHNGGAAKYRRFLAEELKPWVEARYRTDGDDTLMGESLAALFVVETLLRAPELFDGYVAVSPSLWWNRGSLAREAEGLLRSRSFSSKRLFLTVANEGEAMGVDALAAALKAVNPPGLSWTFEPMPAETHASIYHPAATRAFRVIYAPPQAAH